ncbi:MAG: tetratricopeptide repeat protein, partial [candidate division Zixibacteria bacterium]|nr:tetratricopeptide repeat protein [candidate division Zixibacteria bacterium]
DIEALNNLGVIFWRQFQLDSALVYLRQAVAHDPENPYLLYNLGMTFYRLDQPDSAHFYLNRARNHDFNSLRIKENYNQIIIDLARQHNLPLIDLVSMFDRVGREQLFVDHCHPNQLGHRLIAEQLAEEIIRLLQ